jgi:hypothetical protein
MRSRTISRRRRLVATFLPLAKKLYCLLGSGLHVPFMPQYRIIICKNPLQLANIHNITQSNTSVDSYPPEEAPSTTPTQQKHRLPRDPFPYTLTNHTTTRARPSHLLLQLPLHRIIRLGKVHSIRQLIKVMVVHQLIPNSY